MQHNNKIGTLAILPFDVINLVLEWVPLVGLKRVSIGFWEVISALCPFESGLIDTVHVKRALESIVHCYGLTHNFAHKYVPMYVEFSPEKHIFNICMVGGVEEVHSVALAVDKWVMPSSSLSKTWMCALGARESDELVRAFFGTGAVRRKVLLHVGHTVQELYEYKISDDVLVDITRSLLKLNLPRVDGRMLYLSSKKGLVKLAAELGHPVHLDIISEAIFAGGETLLALLSIPLDVDHVQAAIENFDSGYNIEQSLMMLKEADPRYLSTSRKRLFSAANKELVTFACSSLASDNIIDTIREVCRGSNVALLQQLLAKHHTVWLNSASDMIMDALSSSTNNRMIKYVIECGLGVGVKFGVEHLRAAFQGNNVMGLALKYANGISLNNLVDFMIDAGDRAMISSIMRHFEVHRPDVTIEDVMKRVTEIEFTQKAEVFVQALACIQSGPVLRCIARSGRIDLADSIKCVSSFACLGVLYEEVAKTENIALLEHLLNHAHLF